MLGASAHVCLMYYDCMLHTTACCTRLRAVHDCMLHTTARCTRLHAVHDCMLHTTARCTRLRAAHDCALHTTARCTRLRAAHDCMLHTTACCTRLRAAHDCMLHTTARCTRLHAVHDCMPTTVTFFAPVQVYEAYVPKVNDSEEEWPTGGGNPECSRWRSDLPIKMVSELKNVLSLRELQRMERRAMRRRKRKGVADEQTDRQTDEQRNRQTDRLIDGLHGIQTMQYSPCSSDAPAVGNPPVKKETAVRGPASLSSPSSTGLPAGNSLREKPVVGVSAPPSVSSAGESVSELQAVSLLVALLARQQRSPQKEECFGDSSGSEQEDM